MSDSESEALYRQLDAASNDFRRTFKPEHEEATAPTTTSRALTLIDNLSVDAEIGEPAGEPPREPAREEQNNGSSFVIGDVINLSNILEPSTSRLTRAIDVVVPGSSCRRRSARLQRSTRSQRARIDGLPLHNNIITIEDYYPGDTDYLAVLNFYDPEAPNVQPTRRSPRFHERQTLQTELRQEVNLPEPLPAFSYVNLDTSTEASDDTEREELFVINEKAYDPVMTVKLIWKSINEKHIKIKRFTPLTKIVDVFATQENVDSSYLKFFIKDRQVDLTRHSCATLSYVAPQIPIEIEGSVSTNNNHVLERQAGPTVKIKLQHNSKIETVDFPPNMRLEILYAIAVIRFTFPIGTFKVIYDGRRVAFNATIDMIGAEDGDCFDIIKL